MRVMPKKNVAMDAGTAYYKKRVLELINERLAIERAKTARVKNRWYGLRKRVKRTGLARSVSGSS